MFKDTTTNLVDGHDATYQDLRLLLLADRGGLFGDPYYGTILKRLFFEQNNIILIDIVIDAIYTAILQFMPAVIVQRKDITIVQNGTYININIKAQNVLDLQTDLYNIQMINYEVK